MYLLISFLCWQRPHTHTLNKASWTVHPACHLFSSQRKLVLWPTLQVKSSDQRNWCLTVLYLISRSVVVEMGGVPSSWFCILAHLIRWYSYSWKINYLYKIFPLSIHSVIVLTNHSDVCRGAVILSHPGVMRVWFNQRQVNSRMKWHCAPEWYFSNQGSKFINIYCMSCCLPMAAGI